MKKKDLILFLIIITIIFPGTLLSQKIRSIQNTLSEIIFSCDLVQGFNFDTQVQNDCGHLEYLTVGSSTITPDLNNIRIPTNSSSTMSVVGILREIVWAGSYSDPIDIQVQVSTYNKMILAGKIHTGLINSSISFRFSVYSYDPITLQYFKAFTNSTATLSGTIQSISIGAKGTEVQSPENWQVNIRIAPPVTDQFLSYSSSSSQSTTRQWGSTSLPVELTSFNAVANNKLVSLNWKTATEVNNYGFNVERRKVQGARDEAWEKIGFVQGHGNSNSPKSYSFTDNLDLNPAVAGRHLQYRLKQIDFDGKYEYSDVVEVKVETPKEFKLAQNFPNPFNPETVISYQLSANSHITLKVFDLLGRDVATLVDEYKAAGSYRITFNTNNLDLARSSRSGREMPSGIYFYTLRTDNGFTATKKLLLLK